MSLRIAAIADTHYAIGSLDACGQKRTAISDILLYRAIIRLNRYIKPDITVILGDLIDDSASLHAQDEHQKMKEIIDTLNMPVIVIPGIHDGDVEEFYNIYPKPANAVDINGVRIITSIDKKKMDAARAGFDGPVVSLQHGCSNATHIISSHRNDMAVCEEGRAVIVPALCEAPFAFNEIIIDGDKVETIRHELSLPRELGLVDYHVHTPFAYCQQNMDMGLSIQLAREFGLREMLFSEHTGQLYFNGDTFWSAAFMEKGLDTIEGRDNRMGDYLEQAKAFCPPAHLGFEIDCDYSGNPVIRPEDMARAEVRVGAVHWLEELRKPEPDMHRAADEMIARLSRFLGSVDILAHPFRVFCRLKIDPPDGLISRIVPLLKENNVVAEINCHGQDTSVEFVTACVDAGVKLSFGSDSHNLREVGEFYPHLELMRQCGYSYSDIPGILTDLL